MHILAFFAVGAVKAQCCQAGFKESIAYKEKSLASFTGKLEQARNDEKNYTWWMFGNRVFVWENDVKLAKDKVQTYTQRKMELEKQIEDMKTGNVCHIKAMNEDAAKTEEEKKTHECDLKALQELLDKKIAEEKDIEKKINEATKSLDKLVQDDSPETASVKHLLMSQMALSELAHTASHGAETGHLVCDSWRDDLDSCVGMLEELLDAETLKEQRNMIWKIRKFATSGRSQCLT